MKKMILNYKGRNNNGDMLFIDSNNRWYVNSDLEGLMILSGDEDSDPINLVKNIDRFKDVEIILQGHENQPSEEDRRRYMMLSRLKRDCDYYLGYGNRFVGHLWADTEEEQIEEMIRIYNELDENKKPEWLTMQDIEEYRERMIK